MNEEQNQITVTAVQKQEARASVKVRKKRRQRYREEEKQALVIAWKNSGMSQPEFCKQYGISKSSLYKWRDQLDKFHQCPAEFGFAQVQIQKADTHISPIEIQLSCGTQLKLTSPSQVSLVLEVIRGLRS